MARKSKAPVTTEREVLRACLDALAALGIPADRQNTGAFRNPNGQYVRCGMAGNADITATVPCGPHRGKRLEIEVKRPGKRPTQEQYDRGRRVLAAGGLWMWTDDAAWLLDVLRRVLEGWHVVIDDRGDPRITQREAS